MHTTSDGKTLPISDMDDNHLKNTIRLWERKAASGLVVVYGGADILSDEPWYDEEKLSLEESLDKLNYEEYYDEAVKRGFDSFPKYKPTLRAMGRFGDNSRYYDE